VIRIQQPARVRRPGRGGELDSVDRIAPVDGKLDAVPDFGRRRPGLAELARHPADLRHGHAGRIGEHHGHLQQRFELASDGVGSCPGERLRAVAALEQECLTACYRGQPLFKLVAFAGEHQGRQALQVAYHRLKPTVVWPLWLLKRHRPAGMSLPPGNA
jgi:hypothetical protein